jgi:hypothetical protein
MNVFNGTKSLIFVMGQIKYKVGIGHDGVCTKKTCNELATLAAKTKHAYGKILD